MNKFKRDLQQGKKYERLATDYFDYDDLYMSKGYCKEYDFCCVKGGEKTYVEVKSDRLAGKTGNLCIEYEYKGKPSGINATTADYWMYFILKTVDGDVHSKVNRIEAYKIPSDDLRDIVKGCRSVSGGDGGYSKMYLVKKELVSSYRVYREKKKDIVEDLSNEIKKIEISTDKS
jgi:hypothetical protein